MKKHKSLFIILFLVIALPLFVWALVRLNFNQNKKAASGEPIDIAAGEPFLGSSNAPITIVEYGDLQCPYCKTFADNTLHQILQAYPTQVKFVFKDFPLTSIHPLAQKAAIAGQCAFAQDKFWEMHDLIIAKQNTLSENDFVAFANQLNLNITEYNNCYTNSVPLPEILEDISEGNSKGVTATPTFFVNGRIVLGSLPFNSFKNIIDEELLSLNASPLPTPTNNAINWSNQWVGLTASNFYINIEGRGLFIGDANVAINSDHGHPDNYLTLETTWYEGPTQMRLYIYFRKNTDNTWTAFEIRSYNGDPANGDWLYYEPLSPVQIGQSFKQDNVNWYSTDGKGHIHFEYLNLLPFKNLIPSPPPVSNCVPVNKVITVTDVSGTYGSGTCHDIQEAIDAVNGDGYTILINRGDYNITKTINITNKSNIKIEGNIDGSWNEVWLSFNTTGGGGYGIKVTNSSGSIGMLHAEGITPNGLLSIQNSTNFRIYRTYLYGTNSHTLDVQSSSEIEIADSEIKSSAGAVQIENSHNVNVLYSKIHNSTTAISVNNSSYIRIMDNIITANSSGGIYLWNVSNTGIYHNTIVYNVGSTPTVSITGANISPNVFSQNIVAFNLGAGITRDGNSSVNFSDISYNDVFDNYQGYNYSNMPDPTGTNGNISADPLLDVASGYFCLLTGSPALYGSINNKEFMGRFGLCSTFTPIPTSAPKFADVNNDNIVNLLDIGIVVDYFDAVNPANQRADVDGDGKVTLLDIGLVIDNYEW